MKSNQSRNYGSDEKLVLIEALKNKLGIIPGEFSSPFPSTIFKTCVTHAGFFVYEPQSRQATQVNITIRYTLGTRTAARTPPRPRWKSALNDSIPYSRVEFHYP